MSERQIAWKRRWEYLSEDTMRGLVRAGYATRLYLTFLGLLYPKLAGGPMQLPAS